MTTLLHAIIPWMKYSLIMSGCKYFENILVKRYFSSEGKHFIKNLLVLDPALRYTAKECLSHPWITKFQIEG